MHHEYMVQITQPLAVRRYLGLIGADEDRRASSPRPMARAIRYSDAAHWGDSSNKAVLADSRTGGAVSRRRASSIWCATGARWPAPISTSWATNVTTTAPPRSCRRITTIPAHIPRRRRKRNIGGRCPAGAAPMPTASAASRQFERIGWHWAEINRAGAGGIVAACRQSEHCSCGWRICAPRPPRCAGFMNFLIFPTATRPMRVFARPHNVNRPEDRLLDARAARRNSTASPAT